MVERLGSDKAKDGLAKAVGGVGKFARSASAQLVEQANDLRGATVDAVERLGANNPTSYEDAVAAYNVAFTAMNDKGLSVLRQRERATDLIELVESLVNSIANTPRSFSTDFGEINIHKADFLAAEEFARRDLQAARTSAAGAGTGVAAGAAIASVAPTAAMWVATTFGAASTGTAISTLSGAAATNAALAWLGGGALAVGGGGTAMGAAILALSGPIGWGVAGAAVLTSVALFAKKKFETRESKHEALAALKRNTARVEDLDARIDDLLERITSVRGLLLESYGEALCFFGADFAALATSDQSRLAALVNNTNACAALLSKRIGQDADDE